ncbi:MAG TPA: sugar transferase [Candidatus Hydrogenedentes bacterium]|nr:sugar transferase [Candidatus Hydrogenedentota bacterium]
MRSETSDIASTSRGLFAGEPVSAGRSAATRGAFSWRRLRRPLFSLVLYAGDFLAPLFALAIAYWMRFSAVPYATPLREVLGLSSTQFILLAVTLVHVLMLRKAGIYWLHNAWLPFDLLVRVTVVCALTTLLLPVVGLGRDTALVSRTFLLYFWLVLTTLTYSGKIGAQIVVLTMLCFDIGLKRVVVVGNTETARRLMRIIRQNPQLGYRVAGVMYRGADSGVVDDLAQVKKKVSTGSASQMLRRLLDMNPDVVIIATSSRRNDDMLNLVGECTARHVEVRLVPEFGEVYSRGLVVDRVGLIPMVHLRPLRVPLMSAVLKRALDLAIAFAMLPLLGAFLLAVYIRARRERVPALTRVMKAGQGGGAFGQYVVHERLFSEALRNSSHLFLLPQLINVLRGEMSVVGPRSTDPEHVAHYSSWEKRVLAVRPGILGGHLLDPTASRGGAAEQLEWDIAYLDQRSLAFDINVIISALLALTVGARRKG